MREVTFQTLIDEGVLQIGDGYRAKLEELGGGGYPFLRSEFVDHRHIAFDDAESFHAELAPKLKAKLSRSGDTVITTKGNSTGHAAYVRPELRTFVYSPHLSFWRSLNHEVLHPGFLREWAHSPEFIDQLNGMKDSTDMAPYLSLTDQRRLRITVAEPHEQRAIARVLGALDDKIELNRQMDRTLEELTGSLFRAWFVDFEPVVAKAAGRTPFGIAPAVAAIFPATFTDSELDPIPYGWHVGSIADLARYVNGRAFTKGATGTGRMVIRIAELNSGPGGSTVYHDIAAAPENIAQPGDLLFAWSGSLDVYRWHRDEALINQHIFKVVCDTFPQWFVHHALREAMPFFQDVAADKATTMGHIKREHLSEAKLALPPDKLLTAASRVIEPIYTKQLANELESHTLAALRDTLLPKLLSGELRMKDQERVACGAT